MQSKTIACLSLLLLTNVLFRVLVDAQFNGGGFGGLIDPGFGRPEPIDPGFGRPEPIDPEFGRPEPGRPGFGGPGYGHGRPPSYGGYYGRPWRKLKKWGYGGGWYG